MDCINVRIDCGEVMYPLLDKFTTSATL